MRFKLLFLFLFVFLFSATLTVAQPISQSAGVRFVSTLPATCNPSAKTDVLVYKYSATAGLYRCSATNTWTEIGAGGGGGGGSNYLGTFQKSALPAAPATGSVAIVTNGTRGAWYYNGSIWVPFESGARVNMLDFCNPVGNPAPDCTAGIQAAIDAVAVQGGGTVVFPAGYTFNFSNTLKLWALNSDNVIVGKHAVTFEGTNTGRQQSATPNLNYTGTQPTAIDAAYSAAFNIVKMQMTYTSTTWTGKYIEYGKTGVDHANVSIGIFDSYFNALTGRQATAFLDLGMVVNGSIERSGFQGAKHAIIGTTIVEVGNNPVNRWYSNNIGIKNCSFNNFSDYIIWNPNLNWEIVGNDFNPSPNGELKAIGMDGKIPVENLNILRNYWGDAAGWSSEAAVYLQNAFAANVEGNTVTIPANATFLKIGGSGPVVVRNNVVQEDDAFSQTFEASAVNTATDTITAIYVNSGTTRVGNGNKVTLTTTGGLPGGLAPSTTYYVVSATQTTFKLSETPGGSPINITSQGSGTHTYHIAGQSVGIDMESTYSASLVVEDNQINVKVPINNYGSLARSRGRNNTHKAGPGTIPDFDNTFKIFSLGSQSTGYVTLTPEPTDNWGVVTGLVDQVKNNKSYTAAIRQTLGGDDGRGNGDLVIQGRTESNSANSKIDFVVGPAADTKLRVQDSKVTSIVPLYAKSRRNTSDIVTTEGDFAKATKVLDFPSIAMQATADVTMSFPGAKVGDVITASPAVLEAGLMYGGAWCLTNDVITIRLVNVTTATIDPIARRWKAFVTSQGVVPFPIGTNHALGASVEVSSQLSDDHPKQSLVNGTRTATPGVWNGGGGWSSASTAGPHWIEITFPGTRNISSVVVTTLGDDGGTVEPTSSTEFSQYGITDFQVQTWNGTGWDDQEDVENNRKVSYISEFPSTSTTKIRIYDIKGLAGPAVRVLEVEAYQ